MIEKMRMSNLTCAIRLDTSGSITRVPKGLLLLVLLTLNGCQAAGPWAELEGRRFTVEVMDDPGERALGLMYRRSMEDDHGMLFIFEDQAPRAFWMKNTRIPLDIIYFDRKLSLVSIQHNVPPCRTPKCPSYPSTGPAQYVLEVNAGIAREAGFSVGSSLKVSL